MAKLLIDAGADVNIRNERGVVPLTVAALFGHVDVVQVLLDHPKIDPDVQVLCVNLHLLLITWSTAKLRT